MKPITVQMHCRLPVTVDNPGVTVTAGHIWAAH